MYERRISVRTKVNVDEFGKKQRSELIVRYITALLFKDRARETLILGYIYSLSAPIVPVSKWVNKRKHGEHGVYMRYMVDGDGTHRRGNKTFVFMSKHQSTRKIRLLRAIRYTFGNILLLLDGALLCYVENTRDAFISCHCSSKK